MAAQGDFLSGKKRNEDIKNRVTQAIHDQNRKENQQKNFERELQMGEFGNSFDNHQVEKLYGTSNKHHLMQAFK